MPANKRETTLTAIVPCYDEEDCLDALYEALKDVQGKLAALDCKLYMLLIDNGSSDRTLQMIKEYAANDDSVLYLSLSRNYQKEGALYAGLEHARSDYVTIMDADLQDPPDMLPDMYERIINNPDIDRVATYCSDRVGQSRLYAWFAKRFYKVFNKMTGLDIMHDARDYCIMSKRYVDSVLACKERCRFSKGIFCYVGYKTEWVGFSSVSRQAGNAKWSFRERAAYAIDSITTYSTVPLHVITVLGVTISIISFVYLLFIFFREIIFHSAGAGWPSLVCLITFLGGLILLAIGVLGQYLAKIYQEVKGRPVYIVTESKTFANDEPTHR